MHHAIPKPVNLKVLPPDIAPEELIRIMRGFSEQLGVHCTFCHAEGPDGHPDFASDAKPTKDIARTMMLMTRDINASYMAKVDVPDAKPEERKVSCGTCHQGMPIPAVFIPPPHAATPPAKP